MFSTQNIGKDPCWPTSYIPGIELGLQTIWAALEQLKNGMTVADSGLAQLENMLNSNSFESLAQVGLVPMI